MSTRNLETVACGFGTLSYVKPLFPMSAYGEERAYGEQHPENWSYCFGFWRYGSGPKLEMSKRNKVIVNRCFHSSILECRARIC